MTTLELLSPAKDLECGIAAIDCGADAVYIGARRFGARAAAVNGTGDLRELAAYAHLFGAKVYATVNTILYDDELEDTEQLIQELYDAGVDALLVQDMAVLGMKRPPIALHASTQTDNSSVEKVRWLASQGFRRTVLARELSAEQIQEIHKAVPGMELEVFVHGALCVSMSGLCYASQYCYHRSANRGECAQVCRLPYDLVDSDGFKVSEHKHLLSLKDLCRLPSLEELAQAGAVSFKIEGRLKDAGYVKNVTAAYNDALNALVRKHPKEYCRASQGICRYNFKPNVNKTFNRGYSDYFLHGRQPGIASFDTPKAIGERVGKVKEVRGGAVVVAGTATFSNGDGLCFFDHGELYGFRINRAEGNHLYPHQMLRNLRLGAVLYRNNDEAFAKQLAHGVEKRKMPVDITLEADEKGFLLTARASGIHASSLVETSMELQVARSPQKENIERVLSKLGNTPFELRKLSLSDDFQLFIPSAALTAARRELTDKLQEALRERALERRDKEGKAQKQNAQAVAPPSYQLPYEYNCGNRMSRDFYESRGVSPAPAFELQVPSASGEAVNRFAQTDELSQSEKLSQAEKISQSEKISLTVGLSPSERSSQAEKSSQADGLSSSEKSSQSAGLSSSEKSSLSVGKSSCRIMQCKHCLRYEAGFCVRRGGSAPKWKEPVYLVPCDDSGRRFRLEFDCKHCQMNIYAE